jgi:predicted nucleic acid-binding Zn ribbon protein
MGYKKFSQRPEPLGLILSRCMKRMGFGKRLKGQTVILNWEKVVGPRIASKARAFKFSDSKLLVEVENPSWRNELLFMKEKIIKELNKSINSRLIKDIIFLSRSGEASRFRNSS